MRSSCRRAERSVRAGGLAMLCLGALLGGCRCTAPAPVPEQPDTPRLTAADQAKLRAGEVLFAPPEEGAALPVPPAGSRTTAAASPAGRPRTTRVAVVAPLHANTGSAADARLGEAIGEVLAIALADQKHLTVVERGKVAALLQEQQLALSGLVEPATAARLGELLSADVVVAGSIVDVDGRCRFSVHVVAVDGRRVLGSAEADGTRQDLDRIALRLSAQVAALAGADLPPIKPEELDDSPVGRLHLMRGISFYHADNPDQAIASCLRAVQLDPRLQEARLWIARAYLRRGERGHARAELKRLAQNPAAAPLAPQVKQLLAECAVPPAGRGEP
jgi:TolB-like protein